MGQLVVGKTKAKSLKSFAELSRRVGETLRRGSLRVKQVLTQMAWENGKWIEKHVDLNGGRKSYGKKVVAQLSEEHNVSIEALDRMRKTYRLFPKGANLTNLVYSHYLALFPVKEDARRFELAEQANRFNWTVKQLESKVRAEIKEEPLRTDHRAYKKADRRPLEPRRGTLYTYRILRPKYFRSTADPLQVDLGFRDRKNISLFASKGLQEGDIVQSEWIEGRKKYRLVKSKLGVKDLFTYQAYILRIVDGDTLRVDIDKGFGDSTDQYLRLRGIDCPEMKTRLGRKAREFVVNELKDVPFLTITTSPYSEKFGRYLADVFYEKDGREYFLNNELLARGLAERMKN